MDETRILWFMSKVKAIFERIHRDIEAGLSLGIAIQMAYHDLDQHYRQLCVQENLQPINHMLEINNVELHARFALDAALNALKDSNNEQLAREAFWNQLRRALRPSLLAKSKPA